MLLKNNKPANLPWMILKALAALLIGFILIYTLIFTVGFVAEGNDVSQADLINWCEDDYSDGNYASLYDLLTLYELYNNEDFAIYWEAVEGCQAYQQYRQWHQAAKLGMEGAQEKADASYAQLEKLAAAPEFPRNERILEEFLKLAQAVQ